MNGRCLGAHDPPRKNVRLAVQKDLDHKVDDGNGLSIAAPEQVCRRTGTN